MDYGTGPLVRDSHTGKYRRTRMFVFTLGFSRKCIRLLSFRTSKKATLDGDGRPSLKSARNACR